MTAVTADSAVSTAAAQASTGTWHWGAIDELCLHVVHVMLRLPGK